MSQQSRTSPPESSDHHTGRTAIYLRLAVGAGLLIFLFNRHTTITEVAAHLYRAQLPWLILAMVFSLAGETITAGKWKQLVKHIGGHLPFTKALRASYVGMFYNNFFPGSVGGDFARILMAAPYTNGKARAAASIFMQRNTGLAALFIIGLPAGLLWPLHLHFPDAMRLPPILSNVTLYFALALAGYVAANLILFSRPAYRRVWSLFNLENHHQAPGAVHRLIQKIAHKLQRFHAEIHGYHFWLPLPIVLSVITQILDILIVFSLSRALNLPIPLTSITILVTIVSLANLLPITVNGIGLRETLYVSLLASHSVAPGHAIALSLCHFAIIQVNAAVGGIVQVIRPAAAR